MFRCYLPEVESNLWFDGVDPDLESLTLSVTEHALDSFGVCC